MVRFKSIGVVEPNMEFSSCGDANVVIVPVGHLPDARFFRYAEAIANESEFDLNSVQTFYQERQKSPFFNLPWNRGVMRLKFHIDVNNLLKQESGSLDSPPKSLGGTGTKRVSVFEERNILQDIKEYGNRARIFGVIGICSCTQCPDITRAYEEFLEESRMYPNACALRCLFFEPSELQVDLDHSTTTNMIMVPPSTEDSLRQHVETVMQDFCAVMIMGLEQLALKADACDIPSRRLSFHRSKSEERILGGEKLPSQSSPSFQKSANGGDGLEPEASSQDRDLLNSSQEILRTAPDLARAEAFMTQMINPKDDSAKRQKKRKLASVQRDIGFYCLASGSPVDALRHFSTSIELSQGIADFKTSVAALEGYLCSLLLLKEHYLKQQNMEEDAKLVWQNEELVSVEEILELIILNLKLAESEDLSIATLIKYARYLAANAKSRASNRDQENGGGNDLVSIRQKDQQKQRLLVQIIQDVREFEAANLLDTIILNLELSVLFEELGHFRQQVFTLRKASRCLREMLKVKDVEMDCHKSHGIQALMFNMLFSHRSKKCHSTVLKFKRILTSNGESMRIAKMYSLCRSKQGDNHLFGLTCELEWSDLNMNTRIYEESQSRNSGPFLFSPKNKDKGRKLLESSKQRVVWVANELSEVSLQLNGFKAGIDVEKHLDISKMRLCFANEANVMTFFTLVGSRTEGGKQSVQIKAKVLPLQACELQLVGVQISQTSVDDASEKQTAHNLGFENLRKPLDIRVVKMLPVIATRFCREDLGALKEVHLLENEQKQFVLEVRNVGEVEIKRVELKSGIENPGDDDELSLSVSHDEIMLDEGQSLSLDEMKRLKITFSSRKIRYESGGKAFSRQMYFTLLFSDTSKAEAKFSQESKAIVRALSIKIEVHIHSGLVLEKVFLPKDGMMPIQHRGLCVEISNQSEEEMEICQVLLKKDSETADTGTGTYLPLKALHTSKFLLLAAESQIRNLFLHWRSVHGNRSGRINLTEVSSVADRPSEVSYAKVLRSGLPDTVYPLSGSIESVDKDAGTLFTRESTAFQIKLSNQAQTDYSVSFDVKCLRSDGSVASRSYVVLAGVLSLVNSEVSPNAKDHHVCNFGAFFLCPGKYTFILTQKQPEDSFYSNSLVVEVAEKQQE